GMNPIGIYSQVRVRYSTDAASIALPTGPAPDGEVEDYRALVERGVQPNICSADDVDYSAFTFSEITDIVGTGAVGSTARYTDVSVVDGTPVDMVVEVIGGGMSASASAPNGFLIGRGGIF